MNNETSASASSAVKSGESRGQSPGRLSSMELLRMVSMLMVLVLHADYAALGAPDSAVAVDSPVAATVRVFAEQLSIVGVNVFVLISGWFGIRTSVRGVCSLVFQILFYAVVVAAAAGAIWGIGPSQYQSAWLTLVPGYHHWFIRSYLGLMILAPVLNAYIGRVSVREATGVTLAFLLFEVIYGWGFGADGFRDGYSLLSLTGIYMLGAVARRGGWQKRGGFFWTGVYLACALLGGALTFTCIGIDGTAPSRLTAYDSPLVIAGSLGLMLAFAGMRPWHSRMINGIAASCLAVYLIHFNPLVFNRYMDVCRAIYRGSDGVWCLLAMGGWLFTVFAVSVGVDRLRIQAWRPLQRRFFTSGTH